MYDNINYLISFVRKVQIKKLMIYRFRILNGDAVKQTHWCTTWNCQYLIASSYIETNGGQWWQRDKGESRDSMKMSEILRENEERGSSIERWEEHRQKILRCLRLDSNSVIIFSRQNGEQFILDYQFFFILFFSSRTSYTIIERCSAYAPHTRGT